MGVCNDGGALVSLHSWFPTPLLPLNPSLQALASCSSLLSQLEHALQQLEAASSGCRGTGPAPARSSIAAEAPLGAALLGVLRQLQPHAAPSQTVTPRQLVDAFRSKLPAGVLEAGEEHDASEAVEELCRLVAEELFSSFSCRLQPQLAARAAVAAVLQQPGVMALARSRGSSSGASSGSEVPAASREAASACNGHAEVPCSQAAGGDKAADVAETSVAADATAAAVVEGQPDLAAQAAAAAAEAAADEEASGEADEETAPSTAAHDPCPPDAVLHSWQRHSQLPLHGSTADKLQCLRCRHRSMVQLSPFWVLSLPIPTARGTTLLGNVPAAPGASLEACLASAFAFEALQGWHCTRCSLAASLEAARLGEASAVAAAAGLPQRLAQPPEAAAAESASGVAAQPAGNSRAQQQQEQGQQQQQQQQQQQEQAQDAPSRPVGLPAELQRLQQGLAAGGRLAESEAYRNMLARAGADRWHSESAGVGTVRACHDDPKLYALHLLYGPASTPALALQG